LSFQWFIVIDNRNILVNNFIQVQETYVLERSFYAGNLSYSDSSNKIMANYSGELDELHHYRRWWRTNSVGQKGENKLANKKFQQNKKRYFHKKMISVASPSDQEFL
jgi:hypothetical protein